MINHHAARVRTSGGERVIAGGNAGDLVSRDVEIRRGFDTLGGHDPQAAGSGRTEEILGFPPSHLGQRPLGEDHDVAAELQREERLPFPQEFGGARRHFGLSGDEKPVSRLDHGVAVGNDKTVRPVDPGHQPLPGAQVPKLHVHRRGRRQHLDLPYLPTAETERSSHLV